jgi:plastocyanin
MRRRALALLVPLVLTGCGGGGSGSTSGPAVATTGSADAQTISVDTSDALKFDPRSIAAQVGTVTFTVSNSGVVPHNLVFDGDLGKTGTINGKESQPLKVRFDKAGTFRFVCTFHSSMTGSVKVS